MTSLKKKFDDTAGKICNILLPVRLQYFLGSGKEVAVCTLGNLGLLETISKSELIVRIAIVGRLLSENKGIDAIIDYVYTHPDLKRIILCGTEIRGHMAGQALLALHQYGVDEQRRIIGATGPYPILSSSNERIANFQKQITIVNVIGITNIEKIASLVT